MATITSKVLAGSCKPSSPCDPVGTENHFGKARPLHTPNMTTLDLQLNDTSALAAFYTLATSEAPGFIKRLGTLDLRCEGLATAPRDLWREPSVRAYVRKAVCDMPALPVLLSLRSASASWLPLCLHSNGILVVGHDRTEISVTEFDAFIQRLANHMRPLVLNLQMSQAQLTELNAHLRDLRHQLLVSRQHC